MLPESSTKFSKAGIQKYLFICCSCYIKNTFFSGEILIILTFSNRGIDR